MSSRPSRGAARLAAILDALPDALLLVNCNGTVVNANTIALEAFETPGTALVGRGLLDLLPEFDSKRIPGSMRRPDEAAQAQGRQKPTRMVARRTDGTEFPVEVTSTNLEDGRTPYASAFEAAYADHGAGNGFTGDELLMLVVRDLTGTLDTEAELARQQRQTEMILRAASEGVVGVDAEGRIVLVNPAAAQILGYRAGDLGGRRLHPLLHHARPDGSPLPYEETPLADTLRSGRKHRVRAGQVLWAKDGRAVPVDMTTAPVRDGEQLVGAVLAFTDRRPYDALRARHEQLRALLQDALRGPLEQLRSELAGLASDPAGQLWPEANQVLHHLAAGYSRMTTLVDNVLGYQRLDAGLERLRPEPVPVDAVVNAGVESAIELIGPGRAQFAVHAPSTEAEVDPERLAVALAHLIADVAGVDATGSAPAAPPAGVDPTIVVAAAQRGGADGVVRIEVRGPYGGGSAVHEPLVRGVVTRHGGVLQTHEVPGSAGSAYVLEVPVTATGEAARGARRARGEHGDGSGRTRGGSHARVAARGDGGESGEGGPATAVGGATGETTVMPVPSAPARGTGAGVSPGGPGDQGDSTGTTGGPGGAGVGGVDGADGTGGVAAMGPEAGAGRPDAGPGNAVPGPGMPPHGTPAGGTAVAPGTGEQVPGVAGAPGAALARPDDGGEGLADGAGLTDRTGLTGGNGGAGMSGGAGMDGGPAAGSAGGPGHPESGTAGAAVPMGPAVPAVPPIPAVPDPRRSLEQQGEPSAGGVPVPVQGRPVHDTFGPGGPGGPGGPTGEGAGSAGAGAGAGAEAGQGMGAGSASASGAGLGEEPVHGAGSGEGPVHGPGDGAGSGAAHGQLHGQAHGQAHGQTHGQTQVAPHGQGSAPGQAPGPLHGQEHAQGPAQARGPAQVQGPEQAQGQTQGQGPELGPHAVPGGEQGAPAGEVVPPPTGRRRRARPNPAEEQPEQASGAESGAPALPPGGSAPVPVPAQGSGRRARRALADPASGARVHGGADDTAGGHGSGPQGAAAELPAAQDASWDPARDASGEVPLGAAEHRAVHALPAAEGHGRYGTAGGRQSPGPGGAVEIAPVEGEGAHGTAPHAPEAPAGSGAGAAPGEAGPVGTVTPEEAGPGGAGGAGAPGGELPAAAGGGRRARRIAAARARAEAEAAAQRGPQHAPFALPPVAGDDAEAPGAGGGAAGAAGPAAAQDPGVPGEAPGDREAHGAAPHAPGGAPGAGVQPGAGVPGAGLQPVTGAPGESGPSGAQDEQTAQAAQAQPAERSVVAASPILGGGPLPEQVPQQSGSPAAESAKQAGQTGHTEQTGQAGYASSPQQERAGLPERRGLEQGPRVRTLGQGVPFTERMPEQAGHQWSGQQTPAGPASPAAASSGPGTAASTPSTVSAIPSTPSTPGPPPGSGRRRKLATPQEKPEQESPQTAGRTESAQPSEPGQQSGPGPLPGPMPMPQPAPQPQQSTGAYGAGQYESGPQEFAVGAAAATSGGDSEGPEPLDGPDSPVEIADGRGLRLPPQAVDDELPPEPLDNPRRLLVWPEPDVSTQQALSERGYRPVLVHSREEVDAQIAAYPAALFVDPLTGPITRTALQSLRTAAVAAEVPVLVTAGLGQATREAAYGADPAVLLKALAPRDSEQHPPRVLLVEEHEAIARAFATTLERRGMQVAHAPTDSEAVNVAAQVRPNLVVMDLMQVRRRRAGIIDWLRVNGLLNRTPFVVYTSAGLDEAELPGLASGERVLFLAERSTSAEVQSRIVDLLTKIGAN
ncbi:PAS domain-containing protein [Streptomyces cacaoi]|uniref:PAS domain-containing protein n=1 Tax=Streptomyces cacaoi TaxID=1898 RepID=A0A4Y3QYY3_STRCI|nr:PAS domain-containing protein [Streptomyces cacaoi]GEB50635.1 hypothetical protein SCA03_31860 [Streptomyces cacaoi]